MCKQLKQIGKSVIKKFMELWKYSYSCNQAFVSFYCQKT